MLTTTLSTEFIPATNLKGEVMGANWAFLLPDLNLESVICLGKPSHSTLITLSLLSRDVYLISNRPNRINGKERSKLANIHEVSLEYALHKIPELSVDLVFLTGWPVIWRFKQDLSSQAAFRRLLKSKGYIYYEYLGMTSKKITALRTNQDMEGFTKRQTFWLTPFTGEMYTAVPVEDRATSGYFLDSNLIHPSVHLPRLEKLSGVANQRLVLVGPTRRYAELIFNDDKSETKGPPLYLHTLAREAGINLAQYRWGLVAGGGYSTRKLLFFLFQRESNVPELIIKMVRNPDYNYRIENEQRALSQLRKLEIKNSDRIPRVLFFGYHRTLAILGETVIQGVPMRQLTRGDANCPYGHSAVEWLIDLATASANPESATPAQVAEVFELLFKRLNDLYTPQPDHLTYLKAQISSLGNSQGVFPLVFQHGDPGIWNAIVTPDGEASFLDWEAAESAGMPLWDLFYFLRSFTVWTSRCDSIRDPLKGFTCQLLEDTWLSRFWIDSTIRYCQQIGLPGEFIEPLFHTCWVHRALKEATRLKTNHLEKGIYIRLLEFCIEHRSSPFFERLFSLSLAPEKLKATYG